MNPPLPSPTDIWDRAEMAWLKDVFGSFSVEADLSWGIQGIQVTKIDTTRGPVVVKSGKKWVRPDAEGEQRALDPEPNPHNLREIRAYTQWMPQHNDLAPQLIAAEPRLGILAISFLDGDLVLGSAQVENPEVWQAAGETTRRFHGEARRVTSSFDGGNLSLLPNRVDAAEKGAEWLPTDPNLRSRVMAVAETARAFLRTAIPRELPLYPTHADNSPRNWMMTPQGFRLIDFGRAGIRPRYTELDFAWGAPGPCREAFMNGLGVPTDLAAWDEHERASCQLYLLAQYFRSLEWAWEHGDHGFYSEVLNRDETIHQFSTV
ncbi:phosphotransferase family protein [Falsarthrobacter nasiphocae]|uniref:Aminoglycoside phosphotransferase domain-containing protein n=1 Tax=Falsarthrobacter nasiphocae TaxID=189863 RepID=A0AAE4C6L9_9MICC|nr:phosphotransferase [Falsarthrobacter nasiphocae]MDR6892718.1 hypothetical protein [Falsarthrobacter nasiphocae]